MSFTKRGSNISDGKSIAARVRNMNPEGIEKFIYDEYAENISGIILYYLENKAGGSVEHDSLFRFVMSELSKNSYRFVRKYSGEYSFELYLAAFCRERTSEYLKKNKITSSIDAFRSGKPVDFSKEVYPDMEYLTLERRELFMSACEIMTEWKKTLKPHEAVVFEMRVKDHMSFKDIDFILKTQTSLKVFEKTVRKMKEDVVRHMEKAIDSYYGVY